MFKRVFAVGTVIHESLELLGEVVFWRLAKDAQVLGMAYDIVADS